MTVPIQPGGYLPSGVHVVSPSGLYAAFTDPKARLVVDAALVTARYLQRCFEVRRVLLGGDLVNPLSDRSTGRMLICVADHHEIENGMIRSNNTPLTLLTMNDALLTFPYLPDGPVEVRSQTLFPVGALLDTELYLDHHVMRSQTITYWLGNDGGYLEVELS